MKLARTLLAAFAATAVSQAEAAVVVGEDDFDEISSSSILNYNGFDGATVVNGTVDFIASGDFGIQCVGSTGGCIDLDGSTGDAGEIVTELTTFAPGEYTLSFDLSGNQRGGAADSVTITIGSLLNETIFDILASDPFETYTYNFTVTSETTASLVVGASGGDNIGPILDNFLLVQNDADVPEPAALGLLGIGVLGIAMRRQRKAV